MGAQGPNRAEARGRELAAPRRGVGRVCPAAVRSSRFPPAAACGPLRPSGDREGPPSRPRTRTGREDNDARLPSPLWGGPSRSAAKVRGGGAGANISEPSAGSGEIVWLEAVWHPLRDEAFIGS